MTRSLYILDDDVQYSNLLAAIAQTAGWDAICESDAAKFVAHGIPNSGVLVLDLVMPNVDGIEIIQSISNQQSDLSLILVSGFDNRVLRSAQHLAEAHAIPVHAILEKPIDVKDFSNVLKALDVTIESLVESDNSVNHISVDELMHALQQDQFTPFFQPQIDIKTGRAIGCEVLARWCHPEMGIIRPDCFIKLAEENNLVSELTKTMVLKTFQQARKWQGTLGDLNYSINLSAQDVSGTTIPDYLERLTEEQEISPERITLELTETAVLSDITKYLGVLSRLRVKRFSLSIDDFGTGYSSLDKLHHIPFKEMKIDRRFIRKMVDDPEAHAIVKMCISLASSLEMKAVAEGIESESVLKLLREYECDVAQGFYFAKPMNVEDFERWYKAFNCH